MTHTTITDHQASKPYGFLYYCKLKRNSTPTYTLSSNHVTPGFVECQNRSMIPEKHPGLGPFSALRGDSSFGSQGDRKASKKLMRILGSNFNSPRNKKIARAL